MPISLDRQTFLKQSAWLVSATTAAGILMFLTQALAILWLTEPGDYSLMATLYKTLNLFLIPSVGLQTLFAREASQRRIAASELLEASAFARGAMERLALFWLLLGGVCFGTLESLSAYFKSESPLPITLTWLGIGPLLLAPVAMGWLQGLERFPALGGAMLSNGLFRFSGLLILVGWIGAGVSGAVLAAGLGFASALAIALAAAPELRKRSPSPFPWRRCARQFLPPALLLGIPQVFLGVDLIIVKGGGSPDEAVDLYSKAGLFGAGLVLFTTPLAQVMFPRSVRASGADHRLVLRDALVSVAILTALTAGALTGICAAGQWGLDHPETVSARIPWSASWLQNQETLAFLFDFIPRFLWALAPLCLANTLLSHLAARGRFQSIPSLMAITVGYAVTLAIVRPTMEWTLHILTAFGWALTATAAAYALTDASTRLKRPSKTAA